MQETQTGSVCFAVGVGGGEVVAESLSGTGNM